MTPTGQLREEHEGIRLMLRILDRISDKLESGEKVNPEHLERIVEFFRIFVDKCHHGKEEGLLFPEMERLGITRERGPIGVMLMEHEQGRDYVGGMAEAAAAYKEGDPSAHVEFTRNARLYIGLLSEHIEKENDVLFVMGDQRIPPEKQEELLQGFETLEQEKIGAGTHEEFHKLLEQLKEIYLA
ncbi:MAG TPA: hemerythrin domain-containing protein [Thermodesulfobacteriota bacterium]|nr:hemerythrin domain-containing protein [Thermodesulfobacteriota bacterium]